MAMALLVDIACLGLFVVMGRNEHDKGSSVQGFATTLATFAGAWLVAALMTQLHRNPLAWKRALLNVGVAVPIALGARMAFQGHSFVLSFAIVAIVFVSLFTICWRLLCVSTVSYRGRDKGIRVSAER